MEIFQIWKLLVSRKMMIYEVRNKHYFIGGNVLRECNVYESELYIQLRHELSRLRSAYKDLSVLSQKDVEKLSKLYAEIIDICEDVEWGDASENARGQLCELFTSLSPEAVREIEKQISDYFTISNLYDRCFYRESKVYKRIEEEEQQ